MQKRNLQRVYRARLALFAFCAALILFGLSTAVQISQTLTRLDAVERERDTWQRPADVVRALNLHNGSVVVDFGCGAGYFALKLSRAAGKEGRVLAVDIRRISLFFLWLRAVLNTKRNITVIHSQPDDPRLPIRNADAVLIANTYHELARPRVILGYLFGSLRSGGRLVVVDRVPYDIEEPRETQFRRHELSLDLALRDIERAGFLILSRDERFISRPDGDSWWLLVASKP